LKFGVDFIKAQRSRERKSPLEDRSSRATPSPRIRSKFAIESDIDHQRPVSAFTKVNRASDSSDSNCSQQNLISKLSFFEEANKAKIMDTSNDIDNGNISKTAKRRNDILKTSATTKLLLQKESQQKPAKNSINSRCVTLKYFDGSSADEVDQHFSRALNQSSDSRKGTTIKTEIFSF